MAQAALYHRRDKAMLTERLSDVLAYAGCAHRGRRAQTL